VQRASGVPHALNGRKIHQRLGRIARRGRERVFAVIARSEATKQSILSLRGTMDCFASLAMTVCCLKIKSEIRTGMSPAVIAA
jgi:hypothetical protein